MFTFYIKGILKCLHFDTKTISKQIEKVIKMHVHEQVPTIINIFECE